MQPQNLLIWGAVLSRKSPDSSKSRAPKDAHFAGTRSCASHMTRLGAQPRKMRIPIFLCSMLEGMDNQVKLLIGKNLLLA